MAASRKKPAGAATARPVRGTAAAAARATKAAEADEDGEDDAPEDEDEDEEEEADEAEEDDDEEVDEPPSKKAAALRKPASHAKLAKGVKEEDWLWLPMRGEDDEVLVHVRVEAFSAEPVQKHGRYIQAVF